VTDITITHPGEGYASAPAALIDPPTGPATHGIDAEAEAVVVDNKIVSITITNPGEGYDVQPTVSLSQPTRITIPAEGQAVITGDEVTGITMIEEGEGYLLEPTVEIGRPSEIDPDTPIDGADFIDTYHSHAPEELVPGSIFDTLDLIVRTRPGYDNLRDGHGFSIHSENTRWTDEDDFVDIEEIQDILFWELGYVEDTEEATSGEYTTGHVSSEYPEASDPWLQGGIPGLSSSDVILIAAEVDLSEYEFPGIYYGHLSPRPAAVIVVNVTTGKTLNDNFDYYNDWYRQVISIDQNSVNVGDLIKVFVYGVGGGNQLYRTNVTGAEFTDNSILLEASLDEIKEVLVQVNGLVYDNFTLESGESPSTTILTSNLFVPDNVRFNIVVFGEDPDGYDYRYSYPYTEELIATGSNILDLIEPITGKENPNTIVELNGKRIRPPAGRRHYTTTANETLFETVTYDESKIIQSDITSDDVEVYINEEKLEYGTEWNFNASATQCSVNLLVSIPADTIVDVYVTIADGYADYKIEDGFLKISEGHGIDIINEDIITVTSWGDSREQDMLTKVYVGPLSVIEPVREFFDTFDFDTHLFDETIGVELRLNLFELDRVVENSDRLWVTLNGNRLIPSQHYGVSEDGRTLAIAGGAIGNTDVVAVTSFTSSIVPEELDFRIFKDMRNNVAMYSINPETTTFLTQDLNATDTVIYVDDASKLPEPDLDKASFGILEVNGERITYRERDIVNNTITGLRRGTAGTGMQDLHTADSSVTNLGKGNLLRTEYDQILYDVPSDGKPLQYQENPAARFLQGRS
jgi:hypothetical protein